MKDSFHKSMSVDSFFKERLEQMPVDLAGADLQWQSIKQQVKQGPPPFPGANAIAIGLVVAVTTFFVWTVSNKKTVAPEVSKHPLPQENIQPEKKEQPAPPASTTHYKRPANANEDVDQTIPASPVIAPDLQMKDSSGNITIAIRPDSSKKIAVPGNKDSLFIFW